MTSRAVRLVERVAVAVSLALVAPGCGDAGGAGEPASESVSSALTGSCPYAYITKYDGFPIFSSTCSDNGTFHTKDGITANASGPYTGLRWQCVEWAERYFLFKWQVSGPNGTMPWGSIPGAADMCEKTASYYSARAIQKKTSGPVLGDLMVWKRGTCGSDATYGHVAVVRGPGSTSSKLKIAQQNAGDANALSEVSSSCAYCFIHALSNPNTALTGGSGGASGGSGGASGGSGGASGGTGGSGATGGAGEAGSAGLSGSAGEPGLAGAAGSAGEDAATGGAGASADATATSGAAGAPANGEKAQGDDTMEGSSCTVGHSPAGGLAALWLALAAAFCCRRRRQLG
jgi:CHAP domain